MVFSSPCNPSGSVYTLELRQLQVLFKNDNIITISDEIYELINFTPKHAMAGIPGMMDRVVTVNGVQKSRDGWQQLNTSVPYHGFNRA